MCAHERVRGAGGGQAPGHPPPSPLLAQGGNSTLSLLHLNHRSGSNSIIVVGSSLSFQHPKSAFAYNVITSWPTTRTQTLADRNITQHVALAPSEPGPQSPQLSLCLHLPLTGQPRAGSEDSSVPCASHANSRVCTLRTHNLHPGFWNPRPEPLAVPGRTAPRPQALSLLPRPPVPTVPSWGPGAAAAGPPTPG